MALEDIAIDFPSAFTSGIPQLLTVSFVEWHSVTAAQEHEVYLYVNNPSALDADVTVRIDDGTNQRDLVIEVTAKTTVLVLPGIRFTSLIDIDIHDDGTAGMFAFGSINRVD